MQEILNSFVDILLNFILITQIFEKNPNQWQQVYQNTLCVRIQWGGGGDNFLPFQGHHAEYWISYRLGLSDTVVHLLKLEITT